MQLEKDVLHVAGPIFIGYNPGPYLCNAEFHSVMFSQLDRKKLSSDIFSKIEKEGFKYVKFCFSDFDGKLLNVCRSVSELSGGDLVSGIMFDGSSVPGWNSVHESDLVLFPDLSSATIAPFDVQPSMMIFCNVLDPHLLSGGAVGHDAAYEKDPRSIAWRAMNHLKSGDIADAMLVGPEMEFHVFDEFLYNNTRNDSHAFVNSCEMSPSVGRGDLCDGWYRVQEKEGYCVSAPNDSLSDFRSEVLSVMEEMCMCPLVHHHEVGSAQCEVGFMHSDMIAASDNVQRCKYIVSNVATSYGKSATFMPKPVFGDNGNGMHTHQSLCKGGKNVFANNGRLSDVGKFYLGGLLKHSRALNALTNPSTNSYRRLIKGFEAPVVVAYSERNRSAAVRLPYNLHKTDGFVRMELRYPDATCNPYIAFAGMLMAGLDGIRNRTSADEYLVEGDVYTMQESELSRYDKVCSSLTEALDELEQDHEFLLQDGVFTKGMLRSYIDLKRKQELEVRVRPHPFEFQKYYQV